VQETREETEAAAQKLDVAITPLAVPMLSGPGAISTVVLLHEQAAGLSHTIALCASILAVSAASYVILRLSATGAKWLNPIALKITTRIMGLLLAAVASQFMINALRELKVIS
jgi:multiple antibiotic resistance protein